MCSICEQREITLLNLWMPIRTVELYPFVFWFQEIIQQCHTSQLRVFFAMTCRPSSKSILSPSFTSVHRLSFSYFNFWRIRKTIVCMTNNTCFCNRSYDHDKYIDQIYISRMQKYGKQMHSWYRNCSLFAMHTKKNQHVTFYI
jgi:hypothetical protein